LRHRKNPDTIELVPTNWRHVAMTWAQRLSRVFKIDVTLCERCGGAVKIIACIERPLVIAKILEHLERTNSPEFTLRPARTRLNRLASLPPKRLVCHARFCKIKSPFN
jgi:hypothetical protein